MSEAPKSTNLPKPPPPPAQSPKPQPVPPAPPAAPGDHRRPGIPLAPPPLSAAPKQAPLPPPRPNGAEPQKPLTPPVMTRGDRPRVPLVPSPSTVRPGSQQPVGKTPEFETCMRVLSFVGSNFQLRLNKRTETLRKERGLANPGCSSARLAMPLPKHQPLQPPGVPEGPQK